MVITNVPSAILATTKLVLCASPVYAGAQVEKQWLVRLAPNMTARFVQSVMPVFTRLEPRARPMSALVTMVKSPKESLAALTVSTNAQAAMLASTFQKTSVNPISALAQGEWRRRVRPVPRTTSTNVPSVMPVTTDRPKVPSHAISTFAHALEALSSKPVLIAQHTANTCVTRAMLASTRRETYANQTYAGALVAKQRLVLHAQSMRPSSV
jgi:hypothetical protein